MKSFHHVSIFFWAFIAIAAPAFGQTRIAKLFETNLASHEVFGFSVATDGQRVLVGTRTGKAFLYDPFTSQKLATFTVPGNDTSVALQGTTAVVGTPSGVRVFDFSNLSGITQRTLTPIGGSGGSFGHSVDISGDTIIVGANADNSAGSFTGAAYLFNRTTGTQFAKLTANDKEAGDNFGIAVAISQGKAVVGSPFGDNSLGQDKGAVYLYNAQPGFVGNRQIAKFVTTTGSSLPHFGFNADISGDAILALEAFGESFLWQADEQPTAIPGTNFDRIVGDGVSINENLVAIGIQDANFVKLFDHDRHAVGALQRPTPEDSGFGHSVALGGNLLVVTSPGSPNRGAAHVYLLAEVFVPEPGSASLVFGALMCFNIISCPRLRRVPLPRA